MTSPSPVCRRSAGQREDRLAFRDREIQVVQLAVEGMTTTQIGGTPYLSAETIKSHLAHASAKDGTAGLGRPACYTRPTRSGPSGPHQYRPASLPDFRWVSSGFSPAAVLPLDPARPQWVGRLGPCGPIHRKLMKLAGAPSRSKLINWAPVPASSVTAAKATR
ncbi:LuxR C-terminal-related transcriptional regulator [Streptomyces sp. NPDC058279]|uniref:LuxR C-terminal-related transcriptional regulator n=1 Tax=Streptomyces sp. NPDC058279 TaxID=3346418 RepID=UPI0036E9BC18